MPRGWKPNTRRAKAARHSCAWSGCSWHNADPFGVSLEEVDLEVRAGEIVGIAGVAGNGQDELLALLSGEQRLPAAQAMRIRFLGDDVAHLRPDARRRHGMAFVPAERLGHGAVPSMSLADNGLLTAFQQTGMVERGLIRRGKVRAFAEQVIQRFAVKTPDAQTPAASLSGGNLQKFILGREILQQPKLLIAAHPTWGVDVGAAAIHRALIELRDAGAAILVISEDLEELFQISDRIAALSDGRLSPQRATASTCPVEVGRWMAGQFDTSDAPVSPLPPDENPSCCYPCNPVARLHGPCSGAPAAGRAADAAERRAAVRPARPTTAGNPQGAAGRPARRSLRRLRTAGQGAADPALRAGSGGGLQRTHLEHRRRRPAAHRCPGR